MASDVGGTGYCTEVQIIRLYLAEGFVIRLPNGKHYGNAVRIPKYEALVRLAPRGESMLWTMENMQHMDAMTGIFWVKSISS